jgi:hypothetical protein
MKILIAFILALAVGIWIERVTTPKSNTPIDSIKAKNIVREFYKIRDAANIYAYMRDFNTSGINGAAIAATSGMKNVNGVLASSQGAVTMTPKGVNKKDIEVTIAGLEAITNAETNVKASIDLNTDFNITDSIAGDGILVIKWNI